MSKNYKMSLAAIVGAPLIAGAFAVGAMAGNNPVDENRWPSEFGADDQAGRPFQRLGAGAAESNIDDVHRHDGALLGGIPGRMGWWAR